MRLTSENIDMLVIARVAVIDGKRFHFGQLKEMFYLQNFGEVVFLLKENLQGAIERGIVGVSELKEVKFSQCILNSNERSFVA